MSGIGEIVGIIACVAAIVSAYNDGHEIVTKIREKRRQRKAASPAKILDESLLDAARDIETEKSRGITRLGPSFERGDDVAIVQLRQIQIELEAQLFRQLAQALRDDDVVDFGPALTASDVGRDHTVTALIQLRQRLMIAAPIASPIFWTGSPGNPGVSPPTINDRTFSQPFRQTFSPPLSHSFSNSLLFETQPSAPLPIERPDAGPRVATEPPRTRRESGTSKSPSYLPQFSFFSRKKSEDQHRTEVNASVPQRRLTSATSSFDLAHQPTNRPRHSSDTSAPSSNNSLVYPDGNGSTIWGNPPSTSPASPPSTSLIPTRTHTSPSQNLNFTYSPSNLPIPDASNNYLNFCKGAWKLQIGAEGALKKRLEFNSGWSSSEVPYLACGSSRCTFAYRLSLDQVHRVWHSSKGVSFRWAFLAKSHVEQSRSSGERYAYQCLFCAFMGEKPSVWQGVDSLMEHVAAHRSRELPGEVLHRTKCIADRVAGEEEGFDVNLRPVGKEVVCEREDSIFADDSNPWR